MLLLAAMAVLQGCGPSRTPAAAQTPRERCLNSLDPARGVDACRQANAQDPNDAAVHRRLGLLRYKARQYGAARQAYQLARGEDGASAEAQFGLGLAMEGLKQDGGHTEKLAAVARDPAVKDLFRRYGVPQTDLLTYDTPPKVLSAPDEKQAAPLIPKAHLAEWIEVDVKCQVALDTHVHDCAVITAETPERAPFNAAAVAIVAMSKASPAKNGGAAIADAPIILTMPFKAQPWN